MPPSAVLAARAAMLALTAVLVSGAAVLVAWRPDAARNELSGCYAGSCWVVLEVHAVSTRRGAPQCPVVS
jgi:hypothetical protein